MLRIEEVTKAYPGVLANDRVSLSLQAGQVHGLVGENGAGKTTLMGMLYGLRRPDGGRIILDGRVVEFASPREALAEGIAFVQQTFSLIPTLTVAENLVLASRGAGQHLSLKNSRQRVEEMDARFGFKVEADAVVEDLSVGRRQQAELTKALVLSPRVLLLDEPTSVLTPQHAEHLSKVIGELAADGLGIVLITHRLEKVLSDADHISVMRRGRMVGSMPAAEASVERLAQLMIGELPNKAEKPRTTSARQTASSETILLDSSLLNKAEKPGTTSARQAASTETVLLDARHVTVRGDRGTAVKDISLSVRAGEILGIAGVEGSGHMELTEALAGVRPIDEGVIRVESKLLTPGRVREFKAAGVAHIPADRRRDAVIDPMSVAENLVLPMVDRPPFSRFGVLRPGVVRAHAQKLIKRFDIRVPGPEVALRALSGGNQQRVVVARECWRTPRVTIACYPTQGLDFSAVEFVWGQLRAFAEAGGSVVLASVDLDELLALSGRIIVLHSGGIAGETTAEAATSEQLGLMMGGSEA